MDTILTIGKTSLYVIGLYLSLAPKSHWMAIINSVSNSCSRLVALRK
ncbi:hypothetical protein [Burkholderia sp. Cy-637]|nr:hypothetical protein [Burkholderia sp. Cy-637]